MKIQELSTEVTRLVNHYQTQATMLLNQQGLVPVDKRDAVAFLTAMAKTGDVLRKLAEEKAREIDIYGGKLYGDN